MDNNEAINNTGKKEIIKDYRQNGIMKEFFERYFEKWENDINEIIFGNTEKDKLDLKHLVEDVNIDKFVETLQLSNVLYNMVGGNIVTSLYYSLPNYENELIVIELDEKLKLKSIIPNI